LSTLTLNITASEPRLDTGCWLDITRWELPPLYDISLNPLDTLVTNNNDLSLSISHYLFKVSSYENLLASCGRSQIFTERTEVGKRTIVDFELCAFAKCFGISVNDLTDEYFDKLK